MLRDLIGHIKENQSLFKYIHGVPLVEFPETFEETIYSYFNIANENEKVKRIADKIKKYL